MNNSSELEMYAKGLRSSLEVGVLEIHEVDPAHGATFFVLEAPDYPASGFSSYFTFGVHSFGNAAWKYGAPEMCVTLLSANKFDWTVLSVLPERFFTSSFGVGTVLETSAAIARSSKMTCFLVSPFFMSDSPLPPLLLPYCEINILMLVPVYREEASTLRDIGLGAFLEQLGEAVYDCERARLSLQ
jgi:Suppressor of fused protein (SUFU)